MSFVLIQQVKTCEHAEILLSSQLGNERTDAYQIIIGRNKNQESVIKSSPDSTEVSLQNKR